MECASWQAVPRRRVSMGCAPKGYIGPFGSRSRTTVASWTEEEIGHGKMKGRQVPALSTPVHRTNWPKQVQKQGRQDEGEVMEEGRNESHSNLFPINDALADLFAHAFILSFLSDRAKSICTHATTGWGWLAGSLAIQISRIQSMGVWNGKAMSRRIAQSDR
ncbi:hypothetical protein B0O80DRAFT_427969 [Mortierella sp. GBAus27b]|nr:hypothetical protein B0O80DRAFT_427969 [Mortierella sp. GBAus27b]